MVWLLFVSVCTIKAEAGGQVKSPLNVFRRVQLVDDDPHINGAWVGSYNVAKDFPGGNIDDEGNLYDLYASWGAGPIVYGLQRLLPYVDAAVGR